MKSKHPDEYNSKIKVAKNQRINVEEVKLIAKAEAQAIIDDLDIYVHLQNEFHERRKESLRYIRRRNVHNYKQLLADALLLT